MTAAGRRLGTRALMAGPLFVSVLLLVACGSGDGAGAGAPTSPPANPPGAAPTAVPARLVVVDGDDQWGLEGVPLPKAIRLRLSDTTGRPLSGVRIQLRVLEGEGILAPDSIAFTDPRGEAILTQWILGPAALPQALEARTNGATVLLRAMATSGRNELAPRSAMVYRRGNLTAWSYLDPAGSLKARTLAKGVYAARLSPDAMHLAWAGYSGNSEELCLLARNETAPRCTPAWANARRGLEWTPDGKEIILLGRSGSHATNTAVVALDARTMSFRILLTVVEPEESVESLTLARDGSAALIVQRGRLLRLALDGSGRRTQETAFTAVDSLWQVRWSRDGAQLAMIVNGTCDYGCAQALHVINADGTGRRRVFATAVTDDQLFEGLLWSADGREIVISVADCRIEPCADQVEMVNVTSGARREFLGNAVLYDWR